MTKTVQEVLEVLQSPTPHSEIRYIPRSPKLDGNSSSGKAVAIPYVGSEFVEARLDQACGAFGWQTQILYAGNTIAVGVGILNPETKEWLWRWDVGKEGSDETEHGEKAEVTAALKRAARQWGVGRDLKDIPKLNVKCEVYKQGDKIKFSRWIEDPMEVIQRFLITSKKGKGEGAVKRASEGEATGTRPKPEQEPTPEEARKIVFDLMMKPPEQNGLGFDNVRATEVWITQQEQEFGKTVDAYRSIYKIVMDKIKANTPPDLQKGGE